MKIRGIRVDELSKSGFAPVVTFLLSLWVGPPTNKKGLLSNIGIVEYLLSFSFLLAYFSALFSKFYSDAYTYWGNGWFSLLDLSFKGSIALSVISFTSAFFFDLIEFTPVRRFTADVNRLDEMLKAWGLKTGIVELPYEYSRALPFVTDIIEKRIIEIVRIERADGIESKELILENLRAELREFSALLRKRFCFKIEKFDPMFIEADRVIAMERKHSVKPAVEPD